MRNLAEQELNAVSGGDWELELDLRVFKAKLSGDEDVQDMAGAVATIASGAYGVAVEATTDMFEWIANGWNYSARLCSGG